MFERWTELQGAPGQESARRQSTKVERCSGTWLEIKGCLGTQKTNENARTVMRTHENMRHTRQPTQNNLFDPSAIITALPKKVIMGQRP